MESELNQSLMDFNMFLLQEVNSIKLISWNNFIVRAWKSIFFNNVKGYFRRYFCEFPYFCRIDIEDRCIHVKIIHSINGSMLFYYRYEFVK